MRILADVSPLFAGPLTGVGYFTDELVKNMSNKADVTGFAFNFRSQKNIDVPYPLIEQTKIPGKILTYPRHASIDLPLKLFFDTRGYDAVLANNFLLPPVGKIPSFIVIHDTCFIDHPEWVQSRNAKILRSMLPRTINRATGIIVMSKFVKERVEKIYKPTCPILTITIPPKISKEGMKRPARLGEKSNFFLFVSTIEPRKNISTLLDAFETLQEDLQKKYPLVLAGKPGWDPVTLHRLRSTNNKNIIYLDYVSETERNWLYKNCVATIVPSHYEGFGMMTLESLNAGSPVITSRIPPHQEIMKESGLYFEPSDTMQLARHLVSMTKPSFADKTYKQQVKILREYSWDKVADQVLGFIKSTI